VVIPPARAARRWRKIGIAAADSSILAHVANS